MPTPPPPGSGWRSEAKKGLCTRNWPQISGLFTKFHFLPEEIFLLWVGGALECSDFLIPRALSGTVWYEGFASLPRPEPQKKFHARKGKSASRRTRFVSRGRQVALDQREDPTEPDTRPSWGLLSLVEGKWSEPGK